MNSYKNTFVEQFITRKRPAKRALIAVGSILFALIVTFLVFVLATFWAAPEFGVFYGFIALLLMGALSYLLIKYSLIEYEYSFYNGEFTVLKILGGIKRKPIVSINFRDVEVMAKITSEHTSELAAKYTETYDIASAKDAPNRWFIIAVKEGRRILIILEPSEKVIGAFKEILPIRKFKDY